jgi:hypothetical protein
MISMVVSSHLAQANPGRNPTVHDVLRATERPVQKHGTAIPGERHSAIRLAG